MTVRIRKSSVVEAMSLTPLIDIVFLLLIFFLVATRFAEEDRELDVVLPTASEAQPLVVQPQQIFVNIDQDGTFYLGGEHLDSQQLEMALRQNAANNPANMSVKIRADQRSDCQSLITVMNLCNQVGILDYSVTTSVQAGGS
ncbi:MAG: biopolymer transporter ExbD [Pirellulaceae bacterium]|nr:biopolymer transporter ExbD [Pirellulaceae bacterium]|tara:strand:- start:40 stop:465 length:426 start_codon:yes stop_codon:yes gene_type:complete